MSLLYGADSLGRGILQVKYVLGTIAIPVQLGEGALESFSASSISHPSISPAGNSLVLVHVNSRATANRLVVSVSQGFDLLAPFQEIDTDTDDNGSTFIRTTAFWGITDSSPGSGTVAVVFSGATSQRSIEVYNIVSGFDPDNPIRQSTRAT